jgi:hypothetical protein
MRELLRIRPVLVPVTYATDQSCMSTSSQPGTALSRGEGALQGAFAEPLQPSIYGITNTDRDGSGSMLPGDAVSFLRHHVPAHICPRRLDLTQRYN